MFNVKKFILFSSVISIFSEAIMITKGIDLKFFYLVIIINLILLIFNKKLYFDVKHLSVILLIFVMGIISIYLKSNTFRLMLFQVIGISIVSVYYYNFFIYLQDQIVKAFKLYCKVSLYIAIIGILMIIYTYLTAGRLVRLESIMREPAHYVMVLHPAFFYYLRTYMLTRKNGISVLIIGASIILSFSSVGFIGLLIIILLLYKLTFIRVMAASIFVTLGFYTVYNYVPDFKLRIDDTMRVIQTQNVKSVNTSTYAITSNFYVAYKAFKESPAIGKGIGSHPISHDKFIESIPGYEYVFERKNHKLNSLDANSLLLRVLSELGIIGILGLVFFIVKFRLKKIDNIYGIISNACLIYFILKLFREGHYFSPEVQSLFHKPLLQLPELLQFYILI